MTALNFSGRIEKSLFHFGVCMPSPRVVFGAAIMAVGGGVAVGRVRPGGESAAARPDR